MVRSCSQQVGVCLRTAPVVLLSLPKGPASSGAGNRRRTYTEQMGYRMGLNNQETKISKTASVNKKFATRRCIVFLMNSGASGLDRLFSIDSGD
ncbi:uncharacterized protein J3R85_005137 [Psidium guajava]|nr:uncharacterized protein J3R85_005137 [Psidium guajava]